MESAGIDWDNDPILNNELDERIRVYLQHQGEALPNIDALFDEQSISSLSTPSEFSVNTPSSTTTSNGPSESPVQLLNDSPVEETVEIPAQTVVPPIKTATVTPERILETLTMPPPSNSAVKRPAMVWEPPAAKRIKYETKLIRYTAKKQMYFERFRSMKTRLRKIQIPNSVPPDTETIKLFEEVKFHFEFHFGHFIFNVAKPL